MSKAVVTVTREDVYNAYNAETKRYDVSRPETISITIETDKEHLAEAYVAAKMGHQEGGKAFGASLKNRSGGSKDASW